jgi:hypothetical protein
VEYLRGWFSDANFNAGQLKAPPETHGRWLTEDIDYPVWRSPRPRALTSTYGRAALVFSRR